MGKDMARVAFDYSDLPKDLKGKLIILAGSIKKAGLNHIEFAIQMGQELTTANELLAKHGKEGLFGSWIKAECGIGRTTAYNYMNAFERFGSSDCSSLEQFTAEAMYLLSADKVPEEAVETAINLAAKGTRITKDAAQELKRRFSSDGDSDELPAPGGAVQGPEAEPNDESAESSPSNSEQEQADESAEQVAPQQLCDLFYRATQLCGVIARLADEIKVAAGASRHHDDIINSIDICHMALKEWRKEKHAWREKVY